MSDFHKRRNELYAEFPQDAAAYESEFRELQARLAEAEALLREALPDRPMWHHIETGSWRARVADFLEADSGDGRNE